MISVIVTAYNVEKYITACLECILDQTYRDMEILLVDDGSSDQTVSVAKEILNGSAKDIDVLVFNTDGEKDYKATDWDVEPYKYAVDDPEVVLRNLRWINEDQKDNIKICLLIYKQ